MKELADSYTIGDNYHQPAQGGSGIQHVFLGTGDAIYWTPFDSMPTPPTSAIANPNPQSGSNNKYTANGNFTNCSDLAAQGVLPIARYLDSLPYEVGIKCEVGQYYMLNNTNPGFLPNGTVDLKGIAAGTSIPPSNVRTIGDALNKKGISWAYYGGAYNHAVNGPTDPLSLAVNRPSVRVLKKAARIQRRQHTSPGERKKVIALNLSAGAQPSGIQGI